MAEYIIELKSVTKIYNQGELNEVKALTDIDLTISENSMVCLRGASGSGKSTLLSIIGCLFPPTSGKAVVAGTLLSRLPDLFMTTLRRKTIGFIFQHFNILPDLSVRDNVSLPLIPLGVSPSERGRRADALLEKLGISHRASFPARQISGGELQRVAIARALVNDQPIILADEPTAHLDTALSEEFLKIMVDLKENGKTVIIASHDSLVTESSSLDRIIDIHDGRINVP